MENLRKRQKQSQKIGKNGSKKGFRTPDTPWQTPILNFHSAITVKICTGIL